MSCVRLCPLKENAGLAVSEDLGPAALLVISKVAIKASLLKPHRNNNPEGSGLMDGSASTIHQSNHPPIQSFECYEKQTIVAACRTRDRIDCFGC